MAIGTEPDYYGTLGVAHDAEDVVIRAAYRALMQRYHPDKLPAKERALADAKVWGIAQAYRTLSDPKSRKEYDLRLAGSWGTSSLERQIEAFDAQFINPLDKKSWDALLYFHPQLMAHFDRLAKTDPELAHEYKTFLLELVAERVMEKVVQRVSQEDGLDEVLIDPGKKGQKRVRKADQS